MHRRYDLKGSTVGRSAAASGGGGPAEEGAVLKDNDLARPLRLARASALEAIGAQVDADVSFLAAHGLMDYSLLVGVCHPRLEQPHTPTSPGGGGMLSPGPSPGPSPLPSPRGGSDRRIETTLWDGAAPRRRGRPRRRRRRGRGGGGRRHRGGGARLFRADRRPHQVGRAQGGGARREGGARARAAQRDLVRAAAPVRWRASCGRCRGGSTCRSTSRPARRRTARRRTARRRRRSSRVCAQGGLHAT